MEPTTDIADALDVLSERVDGIAGRMDRMERRVLRWGSALIVGLEAARLFLAPFVATLAVMALVFVAGCSPAQRTVAVETACQAAHVVVHHLCELEPTSGGEAGR